MSSVRGKGTDCEVGEVSVYGVRHVAGVFLQSRLRHDRSWVGTGRSWVGTGRRARNRFTAAISSTHLIDSALVAIVLKREILAPDLGIDRLVVQLAATTGVPR